MMTMASVIAVVSGSGLVIGHLLLLLWRKVHKGRTLRYFDPSLVGDTLDDVSFSKSLTATGTEATTMAKWPV